MKEDMALRMQPTLTIILEALKNAGWACRAEAEENGQPFAGVRLYRRDSVLRQDLIYVLQPQDAAFFPADRCSCICRIPVTGARRQICCPDHTEDEMLNFLLELFQLYRDMEAQMDDLLYRNASMQELCELGARLLENPICIHDDWFMMLAMSRDLPKVMAPEYVMSSQKEFIPRMIVEDFKHDSDYLETYLHHRAQCWEAAPGAARCLYVNLWEGSTYRGRLLVMEYNRPLRMADYTLAEVLSRRILMLLYRKRQGEEQPFRSMDDIVYDLLQGKATDPNDETQITRLLGWKQTDRLLCISIKNQSDTANTMMEHVLHSDLFHTFPNGYIMLTGGKQCVLLNMTKENSSVHMVRHMLSPLCRDYCLHAGISSPVSGIREISVAYNQAEIALEEAARRRDERWAMSFADCAIDYMLKSLSSQMQPQHLISPQLQQLREYDREKGTQYLDTLRAYLTLERDIPKTSQKLIIHRTTLLYRLKKIQSMIGINLEDASQRLYLLLSLHILDMNENR